MKQPIISIIVPVYNVEKYLKSCVESLISQTYSDIEILLVNDGSTDNSGKICETYANIDSRVKVFHQTNQGAATARNVGISKATGEFLLFVDSDDTIDIDTCEKVVKCMLDNNVDWVMWTPKDNPRHLQEGLYEGDCYRRLILNSMIGRGFGPSLFKQIYKRALFITHHIQCPPQLRNFEDFATVLQYAFIAKNIYYLKGNGFYHHRINPTSITQSYDKNIKDNIVTQIKYFKQLFQGSSLTTKA